MRDPHTDRRAALGRAVDHDWRPRNCVWELTLRCPLRCQHCGSRAGLARPGELDDAAGLEVAAQLADLGCELVTLSGGEPTLREDWDDIARALVGRGVLVNLVTCGVYGERGAAAVIARRALAAGLCNIGVSLDGTAETHEALRGRGTFAAVVATIGEFARAGLEVSVLTTVSQLNVDELPAIREVAIAAGARSWRLQLAKPMGSLSRHADWVIPPRRLLDLVPWLARMKAAGGIDVGVGDSIGYYGAPDEVLRGQGWRGRRERWLGCQAGLQAIGIEADGGVKGCLSLQPRAAGADPFREASLAESTLEEIWYRPGIFAYNRDADPARLTGACRRCAHAALCRGGAKCVAAAVTGAVTEDPYCFHRVATLEAARGGGWARAAAAAGAALLLGFGAAGCGERGVLGPGPGRDAAASEDGPSAHPDYGVWGRVDGAAAEAGGADAAPEAAALPDAGADAINCATVCCQCDYGVVPPALWDACCVGLDYGVEPTPITGPR